MKNVYIVDDNDAMRQSLEQLFSAYGYDVAAYSSGSAFLADLCQFRQGVALIDLRMPKITGLDVLKILAQKADQVVSIAISGVAGSDAEEKSLAAGAKSFFSKPFDETALLSQVEREFNGFSS